MNAREFFQAVNSKMRGWGYTVEEQEGCWSRSNGVGWVPGLPVAHTNHHFVIPMSASFEDGARNVTYGDSTLSGPKCNWYGGIDSRTGRQRLRFIAAGTANHPGKGRIEVYQRMMGGLNPLGWVATSYSPVADNWLAASGYYSGTEWHHPGDSTPWPEALISMAVDLNAAQCQVAGWGANRCHMHAEHSARKIDMSWHTTQGGHDLRTRIRARLSGVGPITPPPSTDWWDTVDAAQAKALMKEAVSDVLGTASGQIGFMYANEILRKDDGSMYPFDKTATIFNDVRSYGDKVLTAIDGVTDRQGLYMAVKDAATGAIYAVAPGAFWHVKSQKELNDLLWTRLISPEVFVCAHEDVDKIREYVMRTLDDVVQPAAPATHTVKEGETLSSIATLYETTWQVLWDLNKAVVPNPDVVAPGTVLTLPKA